MIRGYWTTTLRVFEDNFKNTPLEIKFKSIDGFPTGNILTSGIIINDEEFNLHKPSVIIKIIEEGIIQKWDWESSKLEISNGIHFLAENGYIFDSLKPKGQNVFYPKS